MKYGIILGLICWIIILGVVQCARADSYFYASVGIGKNKSPSYSYTTWIDQSSAGCNFSFGYFKETSRHTFINIDASHNSQCSVGHPVDNRDETASEHYYIKFGTKW